MSDKKAKYITTTLPYVNSDPHIGFGLEVVQADALARYYRLLGHEVFFNTGTDEHGQKIAQKADEKGEDRQAYVDHYANEFRKLADPETGLNLSFDNFIRTTDEGHKKATEEIWRRCAEKGDIYKKKYSGLYCVGCESFKVESDLVDGKCPDHNQEPELIEEENYFFKLSNYQEYLEEYLSKEGVVLPEWRRQEALNFVKNGLEDFSISREKKRLNWGVPVPDDEDQVMYVWFDALTNYISTLGWPDEEGDFKKFWTEGEVLQLAGKDQVRFQSIMWQAMLRSAGVKATDKVVYHGFINSGGQKMSKSLGNVISPYEMIERYGVDATRYILLRHVHPFDDSDVTWEKMDEWYTANLVNGLGNLVARVMKMAETHLEEPVKRPEAVGFDTEYEEAFVNFNFQAVGDFVWKKVGELDEYIAINEPFKVIKTDKEKGIEMVKYLVSELYKVGRLLNPIMPETSKIIKEAVLANKKPENLFGRLEK
ncbi:MAG: methionine--tRNA ligase [Candidatus Nomurabacteria bacterium]|nr:methionine--tRNA ligase [Candidatus Nomurabacteria bacterium]USN88202.1 MAG: methionine--tRNA ligase [Candidatus Nomurabacteria bacterium]